MWLSIINQRDGTNRGSWWWPGVETRLEHKSGHCEDWSSREITNTTTTTSQLSRLLLTSLQALTVLILVTSAAVCLRPLLEFETRQ
ncbi:hypothetical protein Pcinc_006634 [Petrolisthes cinctipes]|uniref:Uncharacterized protein n=1 Tax=Petrolisthes cinctipes TaxID=88211 RepID=A0AAE1GA88_PETCI|nr:hypothetical protein Pcinc_006634 [Petrolisthes cinctipes]